MHITPATTTDLPAIIQLFNLAIQYQQQRGVPVWQGVDQSLLRQDIADRHLYLLREQQSLAGMFCIGWQDALMWRGRDQANALYLHRIITHPDFKGQRLFGHVLDWAISTARQQQRRYLRMDTWGDNPALIDYYRSFGFELVEYYDTPATEEVPLPYRGIRVVLMECGV